MGLLACILLLAVVAAQGVARAALTDRARSSENNVAAGTMAPPASLVAGPTGGPSPGTDLAWAPGPGDLARGWEVLRRTGNCDGWLPADTDVIATLEDVEPAAYTDPTAAIGDEYCYAVRAKRYNWRSDVAVAVAPVSFVEHRAYTTGGSPESLVTAPGTGQHVFGCQLLSVIGVVCLGGYAPDAYTWQSTFDVAVTSSASWRVSFEIETQVLLALAWGEVAIDAWYVPSGDACGGPSGSTRIGSGTIQLGGLVTLLGNHHGVREVELTPNPSFEPSAGPSRLCLRSQITPGLAGALVRVAILHGAQSFIEGPFH